MRRCIGSERFAIEAHEAPTSEFPVHPARPDGLGRMCTPHWKAYVKSLREARGAGNGKPATKAPAPTKATTRKARRATPMAHIPSAKAGEVERAKALLAEVDALPGPEMAARVGEDDVQAALETIANGGTVETSLGETIDSGTGEADAA